MSILSRVRLDAYRDEDGPEPPWRRWRHRLYARDEYVMQAGYNWSSDARRPVYYETSWGFLWTNWIVGVHLELDPWTGDPYSPRREDVAYLTIGLGPWSFGVRRVKRRNHPS